MGGACIPEPFWVPLLHSLLFPTTVEGATTTTSQPPPSSQFCWLPFHCLCLETYCTPCPLASSHAPVSTPAHASSPGTTTRFKCTPASLKENKKPLKPPPSQTRFPSSSSQGLYLPPPVRLFLCLYFWDVFSWNCPPNGDPNHRSPRPLPYSQSAQTRRLGPHSPWLQ